MLINQIKKMKNLYLYINNLFRSAKTKFFKHASITLKKYNITREQCILYSIIFFFSITYFFTWVINMPHTFESLLPFFICILLYILWKKGFIYKNKITHVLFNEYSISIRITFIFLSIYLLPHCDLFLLAILKIIILTTMQYIFFEKISKENIFFTIVIVIFFRYISIPFIITCMLSTSGITFIEKIFSFNKPLYMNDDNSGNNTQINRGENTVYSPNIHNKTPYMSATIEEVDTANQALKYVSNMSKEDIIKIAEKEILPVLKTHKVGANIDLTYIQLGTLKSIMAGAEIKKRGNSYGGTINFGKYDFNEGVSQNLDFKGSTHDKSNFYKIFTQRLDDIKNNKLDVYKFDLA